MTTNVEAIRRLFNVDPSHDRTGNRPPMPGIYPDYPAASTDVGHIAMIESEKGEKHSPWRDNTPSRRSARFRARVRVPANEGTASFRGTAVLLLHRSA
jgi:hypothetical protein